jgi:hypothetical protein
MAQVSTDNKNTFYSKNDLAQKTIAIYGGIDHWNSFEYIEAEVSVSGFAFKMKKRPFFEHAKIRMAIHRPYSELTPIGERKDVTGILDGKDVYLKGGNGTILEERKDARLNFPKRKWDDLDMSYFANYAFWNYFAFPHLLMDSTIDWTQTSDNMLKATFPDNIPTHSREQEFVFDTLNGRLIQHNYVVDIIGKWAKAAHVTQKHEDMNKFLIATKRIVTPKKRNGKPRKRPVLIDITIHNLKFVKE